MEPTLLDLLAAERQAWKYVDDAQRATEEAYATWDAQLEAALAAEDNYWAARAVAEALTQEVAELRAEVYA